MENYNLELYHHGVKGMKWGVRRYRNTDGTLTDAGKKRYDYYNEKGSTTKRTSNNTATSNKSSSTAKKSSGQNATNDSPNVEVIKTSYGDKRKITYTNNSKTTEKETLDKWAKNPFDDADAYYEADRLFDTKFYEYAKNCREKGDAYADKMLHESLKNYSYEFCKNNENYEGETYVTYSLKVMGNKGFYKTFGDEDYTDDQYFDYVD